MVWKRVLFIPLFVVAAGCSLYESPAREAIANNTNNLVTGTLFNFKSNAHIACSIGAVEPDFLNRPVEALETHLDHLGYAAYREGLNIFLYRQAPAAHHVCELRPISNDRPMGLTESLDTAADLLESIQASPRQSSGISDFN